MTANHTGEIDVNDPDAVAKRQQRAQERAKQRSLQRSNTVYSTKPADYQVRIKIIEARNLQVSPAFFGWAACRLCFVVSIVSALCS